MTLLIFHLITHVFRFGDNFGLFKDENGRHCVVWVTDFEHTDEEPGLKSKITVVGHRFRDMKPSWKDSTFSMRSIHSYVVTDIDLTPTKYDKTQLVGKGSCLYLPQGELEPRSKTPDSDFKKPRADQVWLFDLMDHCVDYDKVRPPVRRGKQPRPPDH